MQQYRHSLQLLGGCARRLDVGALRAQALQCSTSPATCVDSLCSTPTQTQMRLLACEQQAPDLHFTFYTKHSGMYLSCIAAQSHNRTKSCECKQRPICTADQVGYAMLGHPPPSRWPPRESAMHAAMCRAAVTATSGCPGAPRLASR